MALMTKEQYLASLRGLDHWVYIQGEKVRSVPDHPISAPPAMAMAETYHQTDTEDMKSLSRHGPISPVRLSTGSPTSNTVWRTWSKRSSC